jgi:hypothetical protein
MVFRVLFYRIRQLLPDTKSLRVLLRVTPCNPVVNKTIVLTALLKESPKPYPFDKSKVKVNCFLGEVYSPSAPMSGFESAETVLPQKSVPPLDGIKLPFFKQTEPSFSLK